MGGTYRFLATTAALVMVLTAAPQAPGEPKPRPGQLVTVAGVEQSGYSGDGGDARQARLGDEVDVAVAPDGVVYIADTFNEVLRVVNAEGVITTLPVVQDAEEWFDRPVAVATDAAGVLYVALRSRVLRRNPDGTFTVIAGGGSFDDNGANGDGGPATRAEVDVADIAVAPDGSVYVADDYVERIRRVAPDGVITSVAGGDATLDNPSSVAVDRGGNVYFVHEGFRGVQKIAPDGAVSTVLGQQARPGFAGDGGPAADAEFDMAVNVATDADGNLYVLDPGNMNVRVIDEQGVIDSIGLPTGKVSDVTVGPDGDLYLTVGAQVKRLVRGPVEVPPAGGKPLAPGPARWADEEPGTVVPIAGTGRRMTDEQKFGGGRGGMTVGPDGTIFTTSLWESEIIAIQPDGKREHYAGTKDLGHSGDGGPATKAGIGRPDVLAADGTGNLYIGDTVDGRIRKVDSGGTITTFAGIEVITPRYSTEGVPNGDGGPATAAVVEPRAIAVGPDGSLYVADSYARGRIRRIDSQGVITSIAGGGNRDIRTTTAAAEVDFANAPTSLAVDQGGNVHFTHSERLYVLRPDGTLAPVTAEGGGFVGDGGPAGQALLNNPGGLAIDRDGTTYIADTFNNRVRAVRQDGTMITVAGNGKRTDDGDGGKATDAALLEPDRITTDAAGNVYVVTADSARIRRIDTKGTITTVVESGLDVGGQAMKMVVDRPVSVDVDPAGTAYVIGDTPLMAVTTDGEVRALTGIPGQGYDLVSSLAAGGDGSVYVTHQDRVERIYPDGAAVTVVGGVASTYGEAEPSRDVDGKRATNVVINPDDVATGPSGELYLTAGTEVYRLNRNGTLTSIVDIKDAEGFEKSDYDTLSMAVSHAGEIFLAHSSSDRVFAVDRSGEVRVFAGNGTGAMPDDRGDGDEATEAPVTLPSDVAVAADGTVYIATHNGVRRVSTDGDIDTVVEPLTSGGDYGGEPESLALDTHGNLYLTAEERNRLYVVVRPGELSQPFPWSTVWLGIGVVAVLAMVIFGAIRYRGAITMPGAEADKSDKT